MDKKLKILVLYDEAATQTATVIEHLQAFQLHSAGPVFFARAVRGAPLAVDLACFDLVIVHYSVRLTFPAFISAEYAAALAAYQGLKVLFIQDEYEATEQSRTWMEKLGFQLVFTCVPQQYVEEIYPKSRFPNTDFLTTLTGFVPDRFEKLRATRPLRERQTVLAYRGRALPYWYGVMGQDKQYIGVRMRELCEQRGVPCDIEWDDKKRIYGEAWYEFVGGARATLGTESGANVFDFHGDIRRSIEAELAKNPSFSFEEASARFLAAHEGRVRMNQVSPRIFEAVALKTALVLFEGEYSGVVQPWTHYLPLKKDFSNADEIFAKLADLDGLQVMVDRAFMDVIESRKFSYGAAVAGYTQEWSKRLRARATKTPVGIIVAASQPRQELEGRVIEEVGQIGDYATTEPLSYQDAQRPLTHVVPPSRELARAAWKILPGKVRSVIRPVLPGVRPLLKRMWKPGRR